MGPGCCPAVDTRGLTGWGRGCCPAMLTGGLTGWGRAVVQQWTREASLGGAGLLGQWTQVGCAASRAVECGGGVLPEGLWLVGLGRQLGCWGEGGSLELPERAAVDEVDARLHGLSC